MCVDRKWIEVAGEQRVGKRQVPLYRITSDGMREALDHGETAQLLQEILGSLARQRESFDAARAQIDAVHAAVEQQEVVLQEVLQKVKAPAAIRSTEANAATLPTQDWTQEAVHYLRQYRARNPLTECTLPELFHRVAAPKRLTIGQFHDGLRALLAQKSIRLFPYTGADYALDEGEYAMILGKEIKYYAAIIA